MPRLKGRRSTRAPRAVATAAVRSTEPSSTTTTSRPGSNARSSSTTLAIATSSFSAGTMATRRSSAKPAMTPADAAVATVSDTDAHPRPEPEQVDDLPRAVRVRVLVEHALARAPAHLLRLRGIGEQLPVGVHRLVRRRGDAELALDVEPALESREWIRDDRGAGRRKLEETARRRRVDLGMRTPSHVQVDARG